MLNLGSKLALALSALAMATAIGYGVAVGEPAGVIVLVSVSLAAIVAALVLVGVPDTASGADAAPSAPTLEPARPSAWPIVVAAAAAVLAAGAATGTLLVTVGILAVLFALTGWFFQSWAQHPQWTEHHAARVGDRALVPVLLPLGVTALVAVIVVSFSRVLLALPKSGSTFVALLAAVAILGACSLVAMRPTLASSAVTALIVVAGASTVAAGVAGALAGEREFHKAGEHATAGEHEDDDAAHDDDAEAEDGDDHEAEDDGTEPSGTVELDAENLVFTDDEIELAAGAEGTLKFRNLEAIPHNVALYDGNDALFRGEVFSGPGERVYKIPALKKGTYEFRCDVHPTMKGRAVVG